jgi:hypothetical protein
MMGCLTAVEFMLAVNMHGEVDHFDPSFDVELRCKGQ